MSQVKKCMYLTLFISIFSCSFLKATESYQDDNIITTVVIPGGGVRGYATCLLLDHIEQLLEKEHGISKIQQCVKLWGGTSVGASISAGLSAGHSPGEMANFIEDTSKIIFDKGNFITSKLNVVKNLFSEKYDRQRLENAVDKYFGENMKFGEVKNCVAVAYDLHGGLNRKPEPYIMSSMDPRYADASLKQVLVSSAAASTYFDGVEWPDNLVMVDGGICDNCPIFSTMGAHVDHLNRNKSRTSRATIRNTHFNVLVVGNGSIISSVDHETIQDMGITEAAPLIDVMINAPGQVNIKNARSLLGEDFMNIDVDLGRKIELDDASDVTFGDMDHAVTQLIENNPDAIKDAVEFLRPKG